MPLTQIDPALLAPTAQYTGFKNRIINGAMMIDQRNAGASVAVANNSFTYITDRFAAYTSSDGFISCQQVADAPSGFINSLKVTVTTADSNLTTGQYGCLQHRIEGFNWADLAYGSASAQATTLSFWVKSSVTGTFGGAYTNAAFNRAYPFTYTINAANTWEQKAITVSGDTTGTWVTNNGIGNRLIFALGAATDMSATAGTWTTGTYVSATGSTNLMATLNATLQITGVQLEKGSTATSFDYRPYGTELALCQRYFQKTLDYSIAVGQTGSNGSGFLTARYVTSYAGIQWQFKVDMRSTPTVTTYAPFGGNINNCWIDSTGLAATSLSLSGGVKGIFIYCNTSNSNPYYFHAIADAEL